MIRVGQKVTFDPYLEITGFGVEACRKQVTGVVVEVYEDHKWFSVVYGDPKQRTSFNFADIGKTVTVNG